MTPRENQTRTADHDPLGRSRTVATRALRPIATEKGEVIAPLSLEEYEACCLIVDDLDSLIGSALSPSLRLELGDLRARVRAAMDGYEATPNGCERVGACERMPGVRRQAWLPAHPRPWLRASPV
jgi:hypothetical protein